MRKLFMIGALLFAAGPALAQPPIHDDEYFDEYAVERIADPREIARMGAVMDRLLGAVMDLPIGGIVEAVDPYGRSGYRRGDTVRDMATRDDPYVEERLRAGIYGSTRSIGVMSQALARMMPVFQRSIAEMERSIAEAMAEARLGRR